MQHRVDEIRTPVGVKCWKHFPGTDILADLPSRGKACRELEANTLWWNGPQVAAQF